MSDTEIEMEECPDCEGAGWLDCDGCCNDCGNPCMEVVDCETCDGTGEVEVEKEE